jgi:hypothetical protein
MQNIKIQIKYYENVQVIENLAFHKVFRVNVHLTVGLISSGVTKTPSNRNPSGLQTT